MSRTVRDTNLETRAARLRLTPRRKPYWRLLETGLHLGYRRTKDGGGSWIARRIVADRKYLETKVGVADDLHDADGIAAIDFRQAQEAARAWWAAELRIPTKPAMHSNMKPATYSDLKPASVPI